MRCEKILLCSKEEYGFYNFILLGCIDLSLKIDCSDLIKTFPINKFLHEKICELIECELMSLREDLKVFEGVSIKAAEEFLSLFYNGFLMVEKKYYISQDDEDLICKCLEFIKERLENSYSNVSKKVPLSVRILKNKILAKRFSLDRVRETSLKNILLKGQSLDVKNMFHYQNYLRSFIVKEFYKDLLNNFHLSMFV